MFIEWEIFQILIFIFLTGIALSICGKKSENQEKQVSRRKKKEKKNKNKKKKRKNNESKRKSELISIGKEVDGLPYDKSMDDEELSQSDKSPTRKIQSQHKGQANQFDKATRDRHMKYMKDKIASDKEAAKSSKFKLKGPIHIPKEPTEYDLKNQRCEAPNDIVLTKVYFDEKLNERYIIGTDYDDIELDDTTVQQSTMQQSTHVSVRDSKRKKKKPTAMTDQTSTVDTKIMTIQ